MKPGDVVEFVQHSGSPGIWKGAPIGMHHLAFSHGYRASAKLNIVAQVSQGFFTLTAYPTLWAPCAAARVVSSPDPPGAFPFLGDPATFPSMPPLHDRAVTDGEIPDQEEPAKSRLEEQHPHGHPEFAPLLAEMAKLHSDKNHDYACGGPPLGNFERVAVILSLYPKLRWDNPVTVILGQALKQVDAVLWMLAQGHEPKVEGPISRLSDVMVYAGLAICALKDRSKGRGPNA